MLAYEFSVFPDLSNSNPPHVLSDFAQADKNSLDYTVLLNAARKQGRFMFLDSIHTTDEANTLIARAIYNDLFPVI